MQHNIKTKSIVFYVILTAALLVYFVVMFPSLKSAFKIGTVAPSDFVQDYIAARQLISGKSVYPANFTEIYKDLLQESPNFGSISNNAHPPFVSMLLFPLGFLSFKDASFLWCLIEILCTLFIIFLLLKSEDISLIYFPLILLFILAWQPFQSNLRLGQISILLTLYVIVGWFFYKKGNDTVSGIFIALATMLEFYPGLLIVYFLINKKRKAFLSSIISVGIIIVLTLIVTRYDFFYFIFKVMPQDVKYWQANFGNYSINGFFSTLFLPMSSFNNITNLTILVSPFFKNLFLYVTEALLLLYAALHIKKYNNDLGFSLFIILSLLLSPLCRDYCLTLLLLPFAILIKELIKRNNKYEIAIFLVVLFLTPINEYSFYFRKVVYIAHLYLLGGSPNFIDALTFFFLRFYGMLLLLFLNFRMIRKSTAASMESKI